MNAIRSLSSFSSRVFHRTGRSSVVSRPGEYTSLNISGMSYVPILPVAGVRSWLQPHQRVHIAPVRPVFPVDFPVPGDPTSRSERKPWLVDLLDRSPGLPILRFYCPSLPAPGFIPFVRVVRGFRLLRAFLGFRFLCYHDQPLLKYLLPFIRPITV